MNYPNIKDLRFFFLKPNCLGKIKYNPNSDLEEQFYNKLYDKYYEVSRILVPVKELPTKKFKVSYETEKTFVDSDDEYYENKGKFLDYKFLENYEFLEPCIDNENEEEIY